MAELAKAEQNAWLWQLMAEASHQVETYGESLSSLSQKFKDVVAPIFNKTKFSFDILDSDAAFVCDSKAQHVTFNLRHIEGIVEAVGDAYDRGYFDPSHNKRMLEETAVRLFIFHELHHISQGVAEYERIQELKAVGADREIARLDLIADQVAMHVHALLFSAPELERGQAENFWQQYRAACTLALYISGQVFFRAFDFSLAKKEKNNRAIGLTLMAARLTLWDEGYEWFSFGESSLDDPLWCIVADDYSRFVVFTFDPHERLLCSIIPDHNLLGNICSGIGQADFTALVGNACSILLAAGIMQARSADGLAA